MQQYIKVAHEARGREVGCWTPCELCGTTAVDVHHINGRKGVLLNDPKNLIFLCRKHHTETHAKNTTETKEKLTNIVLHIINDI